MQEMRARFQNFLRLRRGRSGRGGPACVTHFCTDFVINLVLAISEEFSKFLVRILSSPILAERGGRANPCRPVRQPGQADVLLLQWRPSAHLPGPWASAMRSALGLALHEYVGASQGCRPDKTG